MTVDTLRAGSFADAIRRHRLIVVLRHVAPQAALLSLVEELAAAGVHAFEIPFDTSAATADLEAVRTLLAKRPGGPFHVGAGTVLRRHDLEAARRAHADFAASTLLDPSLVATATDEGLPFIPGAFTPTEVAAAWAAGATFVKLFPASAAGPSFVRELRGPMPEPQLIPSGGIDASNALAFLDAGAAAVGIGTAIVRGDAATRRMILAAVPPRGDADPPRDGG